MTDAVTGGHWSAIAADGGLLGDVTSVALNGTSQRVREILEGLFVETMICDERPSAVGRALCQASGDRVLIVRASEPWAGFSVEVLLALLCWPEGEAIALASGKTGEDNFALLVRRELGSEAAMAWSSGSLQNEEGQHRKSGQADVMAWVDSLTPEWVSPGDLGIAS